MGRVRPPRMRETFLFPAFSMWKWTDSREINVVPLFCRNNLQEKHRKLFFCSISHENHGKKTSTQTMGRVTVRLWFFVPVFFLRFIQTPIPTKFMCFSFPCFTCAFLSYSCVFFLFLQKNYKSCVPNKGLSTLVLRVFVYIMLGLVKIHSTSLQMKSNELPHDLVIGLWICFFFWHFYTWLICAQYLFLHGPSG